MKSLFLILSAASLFLYSVASHAQIPEEQLLWPNGIPDNPVKYEKEIVNTAEVMKSSLSEMNRIITQVSTPTYAIYNPEKGTENGVAIVIAPGGGFRVLCYDREGSDLALWLAKQGITSLVLKYRTFNSEHEEFNLQREKYNPHVYADARQAIHILRSRSEELRIDKNKIGIGGFSAGGALSLFAALDLFEKELPAYAKFTERTSPDFACLIYPGISDAFFEAIENNENIPPMFIINGAEDDVTPADKTLKLYSAIRAKNVPAEIHIYSKGKHGFDSGIGRGQGISIWRDSFLAWLKDLEFINK